MHPSEMAGHTLSTRPAKMKKEPHKPLKEFHARELHDGTYMHRQVYGMDKHGMPIKPDVEGSGDLDAVHDALEEHMGGPHSDDDDGDGKDAEGDPVHFHNTHEADLARNGDGRDAEGD